MDKNKYWRNKRAKQKKQKKSLLILINPEDTELNSWQKFLNTNYIYIIRENGVSRLNDSTEKISALQGKDILFKKIGIVGHGGDGAVFFHGIDSNTVIKHINFFTKNIAQNAECRFQTCSIGTKKGGKFFQSLFPDRGVKFTAPKYLSAIKGTRYYDFGSGVIDVDDLKLLNYIKPPYDKKKHCASNKATLVNKLLEKLAIDSETFEQFFNEKKFFDLITFLKFVLTTEETFVYQSKKNKQ